MAKPTSGLQLIIPDHKCLLYILIPRTKNYIICTVHLRSKSTCHELLTANQNPLRHNLSQYLPKQNYQTITFITTLLFSNVQTRWWHHRQVTLRNSLFHFSKLRPQKQTDPWIWLNSRSHKIYPDVLLKKFSNAIIFKSLDIYHLNLLFSFLRTNKMHWKKTYAVPTYPTCQNNLKSSY